MRLGLLRSFVIFRNRIVVAELTFQTFVMRSPVGGKSSNSAAEAEVVLELGTGEDPGWNS